jgi:type I restriction enzyme, R subunit
LRSLWSRPDTRKALLEGLAEKGVEELDQDKLPQLLTLKYDDIRDAVAELGSVVDIRTVFTEFQQHLYSQSIAA